MGRGKKIFRMNIFGRFLLRRPLNYFPNKILLDINMTSPLKMRFSKSVYNRRTITLSKASNCSFSDYPCSSSFEYFDAVLSILKTADCNV